MHSNRSILNYTRTKDGYSKIYFKSIKKTYRKQQRRDMAQDPSNAGHLPT